MDIRLFIGFPAMFVYVTLKIVSMENPKGGI